MPVLASSVSLTRVADGAPVEVRLLLSGTGETLAVIPEARLAAGTAYRLTATTLTDAFNGTVVVPATTFPTAPEAALTVDPTRIAVSMPSTQGVVTITAPAGTLPPGSTVLIVNTGSGEVLSVMAGNDGSVTATLVASIADRLLITVTDPDGRTTSLTRSTFVAEDGTTGVNRGGGVVSGPGGVELRVPEGAIAGSFFYVYRRHLSSSWLSTGVLADPQESTQFLEGYRRRRDGVPAADAVGCSRGIREALLGSLQEAAGRLDLPDHGLDLAYKNLYHFDA